MRKFMTTAVITFMSLVMSVSAFAGSRITEKEAVNKALKDAGLSRARVTRLEAEYDDGKYEIEFTKKTNKTEYDYEVSKKGRILEKSVDRRYKKNHSHKKIGKIAARKKVAKFSGISLKVIKTGTCRYEYDDGEGTYEIKFRKGSYKYDYDVLAPTGKVIEYSKKYVK